MKLDMVGIITKDMQRAIGFYETLGFNKVAGETLDYVELQHEGVRISLNTAKMVASIYGYEPKTVGDTVELAFLCETPEDVDCTYFKMSDAGYESFRKPWDTFWGQRYAIIKDIDGNLLSLFADLN
ncbi:VOC family protein [uncultured Enterococcus sp.]|uniref:VOC family protein n=1 Tax=uncultured Enterococcus sp. TaxID=167972 RepID=UPI0025F05B1B|nr:VOC family protein [uncultured Enterococcus sp.]